MFYPRLFQVWNQCRSSQMILLSHSEKHSLGTNPVPYR